MKSHLAIGWLAAAACALTACGSAIVPDDVGFFDDARVPDATLSFDAHFTDALGDVFVDATKFNGGGPFDCNGCVCDGTLNACVFAGGGGAPIFDDAGDAGDASDASDVSDASDAEVACDDGGTSPCVAIPIQCLPKPTCACLVAYYGGLCTCGVDPSGDGLIITCPPKP